MTSESQVSTKKSLRSYCAAINCQLFNAFNLAAQVLSHSVSAGINTLCALKHLPDEASATAEFIETFDQLLMLSIVLV